MSDTTSVQIIMSREAAEMASAALLSRIYHHEEALRCMEEDDLPDDDAVASIIEQGEGKEQVKRILESLKKAHSAFRSVL